MKTNLLNRTWLSPLVTVAFGVIGVTGVLLFFHIKNGIIMSLHEWVGWGFVIAGFLHLLLNWQPLINYLRHRSALAALVISGIMVVGLAIAGTSHQEQGGGRRPSSPVMSALDADGNGFVETSELLSANAALMKLDKNGDGRLGLDELQPGRPDGGEHSH